MSTCLQNVKFLNAGHCIQSRYFVGWRSMKLTRFYAVFVYFEHPTHGPSLIDTGYSEHFLHATRRLPQRLYRWATPMTLPDTANASGVLEEAGLMANDIARIFISHFHGDHIAGLKCFGNSQFICRGDSLDWLRHQSTVAQVRNGFLAELLPDDFDCRSVLIPEVAFASTYDALSELNVYDFFDDGSLLLIDLPGHAVGHTGYLMRTAIGPLFYIVDAAWDVSVLRQGRSIPYLATRLQHDMINYERTQDQLRHIDPTKLPMVACHCPQTQNLIRAPNP